MAEDTTDSGPAEAGENKRRGRRRWWTLGALVAAIALVGAAVVFAVAWHYSGGVLNPSQAKAPLQIEVLGVAPGRVKLERAGLVNQPKVYGLEWRGGHALLGPVIGRSERGITRRISRVEGDIQPGDEARITLDTFRGNPRSARGLPYKPVKVPGELGPLPAWQIGPRGNPNWAIFVHGLNTDRGHGLRVAPAIARAGLTSLFISYRNDKGAPSSSDGKHHLGETEWRDLAAAVRFAMRRGARNIALVGYSMGGAIVTQFMLRSPRASAVRAMVLDSPALDWPEVLAHGAKDLGLPGFAAKPVEWVVSLRIGTDWDQLDVLDKTDQLRVPTLLIHGEKDSTVPVESSERYAEELPRHVRFIRPERAGHVQAWNLGPKLYEAMVTAFLRRQMPRAPRFASPAVANRAGSG